MTPEHQNERESLATAFIVVVLAFVFMSLFISSVGAAEYTVTVERSAYSVRAESEQSEKPLLFVYTTSNCQPCETANRELKAAKDLPFKPIFDRKPNIEIEAYPTFHWTTKTGGWTLEGWYGVKHLESEWRKSNNAQDTQNRRDGQHWTYPGEIRHHLRSVHGLPEATYLTKEQAEKAHDFLHNGGTVRQLRAIFGR